MAGNEKIRIGGILQWYDVRNKVNANSFLVSKLLHTRTVKKK
jgi:hypothetical protein